MPLIFHGLLDATIALALAQEKRL